MKVAIVEDSSFQRAVIKKFLEKMDLEITEFESADLAIKSVSSGQFALVITDLVMPGMSGTDFIKKLYELGVKTPCILLTADEDTQNFSLEGHPNLLGVVSKPLTSERPIHEIVRKILK